MDIKLTFSFDAEALAVLNRLAIALKNAGAGSVEAPAPVAIQTPDDVNPTTAAAQETASAATDACPSEPAPAPAPVTKWTLGEIRKRVMDLGRVNDELKAAAKALVNEYAPKVTEIPVEKYDEFMKKLEALYVRP